LGNGNRIRELRESAGLTLDALAERVGTTNQQISHLEMGKRKLTVQWLRRLAHALGCHPWLLVECDLPAVTDTNERDLLALFRSLDRPHQDAVLGYLGLIELAPSAPR
jgi:transcriptional regulator with XRE-family HTH domain